MRKPGRPKNPQPITKVPISATPKLLQHLDNLIKEEAYGNSRAGVAQSLVWRMIEELISKGVLPRQKGPQSSGKR